MRISDWSSDVCSSDLTIAGYFGGWRDRSLMWFVDLMLVVPSFLLISIVVQRTKGDIFWLIVLLAVFSWIDRKSVVSGKSVSVRVDLGGRRIIKKKNQQKR